MTTLTKSAAAHEEVTISIFHAFTTLANKLRAALVAEAPIGYEDETGFHTGIKPRGQEAEETRS